ncbi:universal stress protein PHOS32-like [Pecten maximus]|uniref:universal stress protein PHOS32-like n=1 Tax=Pecten maximus TaxID=6579 RepID=UPI001458B532|nr:universal stress protein PHOS32-like [Pecten maximus]
MEGKAGQSRSVVIAMDTSPSAKKAFQWYIDNIHRPGDHVVLVTVVHVRDAFTSAEWCSLMKSLDSDLMTGNIAKQRHELELQLDELTAMINEAKVSGTVQFVHASNARKGILGVAEDCKASCIVVGSRGLGNFQSGILGSTSEQILNNSDVTIILCPN